jgi:ATPase subunit of ABC transporter with duplicated ATPase domains
MQNKTVLKFDQVSFSYGHNKPILDEVSFSVRQGMKIALMGQNGAGKSTLFGLITDTIKPESGKIHTDSGLSIAIARQVIPRDQMNFTVREFFETYFKGTVHDTAHDIDSKIRTALTVVNLSAPYEKIIKSFSGGQQARLLLASALIANPDILLLDEPTNNLDRAGIDHLADFLINYNKTVILISHDANFLNSFVNGVLYLDVFTKKIEQYQGDYYQVVEDITARIEKENMKNAQLAREIQRNKDQANVFAHKGGKLRAVARRMRDKAEELEEAKVDVRKEDKAIRPFTIPAQEDLSGVLISINSFTIIKNHEPIEQNAKIALHKNYHLLLSGPNGIGKSTLLESIAKGNAPGITITRGVKIGYYRQDFSTLNFDETVYDSLRSAMEKFDEHEMRSLAASFLITGDVVHTKIGALSEGQKGLVAFARLVLEKPGLLILDEPTNHINFRHIPVIAEALSEYKGAMILVSHVPEFVEQIRINEVLDLTKEVDNF